MPLTPRERVRTALARREPDRVPFDLGSTQVTSIASRAQRRLRARLGLSAADYGELVGVSALTIYNWEKGKGTPRPAQLDAWLELVGIGKRDAWERLGYE